MKIVHWAIKYTTSDGEEHYVNDIPNYVATNVDEFLDLKEEEMNNNE